MTFTFNLHRNLIELALVSHKPCSNDCCSVKVRATVSNMLTCKRVLSPRSGEFLFTSIRLAGGSTIRYNKPQQSLKAFCYCTITENSTQLTLSVSSDISVTSSRDSNNNMQLTQGDVTTARPTRATTTTRAFADKLNIRIPPASAPEVGTRLQEEDWVRPRVHERWWPFRRTYLFKPSLWPRIPLLHSLHGRGRQFDIYQLPLIGSFGIGKLSLPARRPKSHRLASV
jgi:hypothetical protein